MTVIGLDLSLTSTGVATAAGTQALTTRNRGVARLITLRDQIVDLCLDADLVVIEGYSFNSRNQGHQVGELGGLVRVTLCEHDVPFAVVAPTQLKKYAIGKGGGKGTDKTGMATAAMKRAGIDFAGRDDECDAWWLRAMGCDHLGEPVLVMPAAHREVLDGIEWPPARVRGAA